MAVTESPSAARGERQHTGLALAVVMAGVLMAAVDTTIVVLALPAIERDLKIALGSVVWVIVGYLLVITLLATQVGRLGDMFGRVRMYELGFGLFVVGSALCAVAFDEGSMIAFRVIQGVGGALISANSGAIIADLFPPQRRGRAYGITAFGWSLGAVLGIVLGGVIVTYISWRWIFWINVPIGILAVVVALRVLHEQGQRRRHYLDLPGMATLGAGLFGVLWAITKLASENLNGELLGWLLGGLALIAAFAVIELRTEEPMLNLALFRVPTMTPSLLAAAFQALGNFAVLFLVIMYLQGPRALSPLHASLLLVPGYVIGGVIGPFAGRLADRRSPVLPATAGLAIQVVALAIYAQLGLHSPLWVVVVASIVNGVGASCFFPANNSAVMKASPKEVFGISSGMLRTFSNIGMVFSYSIAILIASNAISRHLAFAIFVGSTTLHGHLAAAFTTGLHAAFYASAGVLIVAALLSATRAARNPKAAQALEGVPAEGQP
jgi:EmrB/QacA subfamily drug resistance transporter